MTVTVACADGHERDRAVATALAAVRRGDLVVVPVEGAYAIVTDAFSARGVRALRDARMMDADVPLPVMVGARATVSGVTARVGPAAQALIDGFWPGPVTLLLTPAPSLAWSHPQGAPLALRMPLHPVALAVLAATGPLVVTTANVIGEEAPRTAEAAAEQLGLAVSVVLDAGPCEPDLPPSTIVDATGEIPVVVREGAVSIARITQVCPDVRTAREGERA